MMHRGLHVNVWLQSNSERSKPHVNVTQVIKVTSLQKIRVCHWGFFHAVLVEYLSISCNHNTTSSFAVFSFAWIFYFINWNEGEVRLEFFICNYDHHLLDSALVSVIGSFVSFFSSSYICFPPNPVIPHCFSADSGCRKRGSSNWRPV